MRMSLNELKFALILVLSNPELIAWCELSDRGNSCVNWYRLSNTDMTEIAVTRAFLEILMPKKSQLFRHAQCVIAHQVGTQHISYDWTTKALSRLLSNTSLSQFVEMLILAKTIQQRAVS